jgi:3-hydroxyacyl-CoA dehydrogenase
MVDMWPVGPTTCDASRAEGEPFVSDPVSLARDGEIEVVTLNNPPVNALSPSFMQQIREAIESLRGNDAVRGIVLIGGGRTFCGGADIHHFGKITSGEARGFESPMPGLLEALEQFPKPVVAAIHGFAFGGGLELAMACHYRVADVAARVGQPEVKLGLMPGAGGTQRLARLAGVARAAEMCAIGNPIATDEALACGILDRVCEGELLPVAVEFARQVIARGGAPRRTCDLRAERDDPAKTDAAVTALREGIRKKTPRLEAPLKAIEAVETASRLAFADGLKLESRLFGECLFSEQSKALIHVFFGEREVAKIPGLPGDTPVLPIRRAAVVGAGTMGGGIAMAYANAGIPLLLKDVSQDALDRGLETIRRNYAATVRKGRLGLDQIESRLALIRPTLTYDGFAEADIVVEAVFEGMELKKRVFEDLDKVARPDAVLASNTSTLDIDAIASVTNRPERVIGHHFFSPANVMRLLEIVRGQWTSPTVLVTSMALAKTLGKVGVLVGNCRGFVSNRMFGQYQREAQFLVEEGARVEEVDKALVDFGLVMGPLAVGDLAGLDVGWRIRLEYRHLVPPGRRQPLVADHLCEMGRFGQKTGAGWYRYPEGTRSPVPDSEVERIIVATAGAAGIARRPIEAREIVERTVYALINEGARILEEGFASRAVDIDTIYINGFGFPADRGGPMWYADTVGLAAVLERIVRLEEHHGDAWKPAKLLRKLAEGGRRFADYDREGSASAS